MSQRVRVIELYKKVCFTIYHKNISIIIVDEWIKWKSKCKNCHVKGEAVKNMGNNVGKWPRYDSVFVYKVNTLIIYSNFYITWTFQIRLNENTNRSNCSKFNIIYLLLFVLIPSSCNIWAENTPAAAINSVPNAMKYSCGIARNRTRPKSTQWLNAANLWSKNLKRSIRYENTGQWKNDITIRWIDAGLLLNECSIYLLILFYCKQWQCLWTMTTTMIMKCEQWNENK